MNLLPTFFRKVFPEKSRVFRGWVPQRATSPLSSKCRANSAALPASVSCFPASFSPPAAAEQFVAEEKRETPVDLHYAEQVIDDAIYHLPTGYTVESAPPAVQLPWPEHAALVVKTQPAPGVIDIKHIFARGFVLLDPKEYSALRDYYQKIARHKSAAGCSVARSRHNWELSDGAVI